MDMRVRSSRGIKSSGAPVFVHSINCGDSTSWYPSGFVPSTLSGVDETMLDYVVPRFRERRRAGEVFFNNMSHTRVEVNSQGTDWHRKNQSLSCATPGNLRYGEQKVVGGIPIQCIPTDIDGRPLEPLAIDQSEIDRITTLVSTEVLSKRGRSDSDLWETLAEYKQVLDLLQNPLTKLQDLSSRLLKATQRSSASRGLMSEISSGYLLYRYGITPLMKDVENIIKSLSKVTGNQRKTTRASERLFASRNTSGVVVPYGVLESSWVCETRDSINIRGMSLDEVDTSFLGNLGFSFKSLTTLPWELMTYSFVADWFANVGDVIGAHAPSLGYKQLGSCLVIERVTSQSYLFNAVEKPGYTLVSPCQGSVGLVRQSKTRSPLAYPGLALKSDFRFSEFTRAADATALIASRFSKIKQLVGPTPRYAFREKKAYSHWLNQPGVT